MKFSLSAWWWKDGQKISNDDWLNPCMKINYTHYPDLSSEQVIFNHIIYIKTIPANKITMMPTSTTFCGNYFDDRSKYKCFSAEPNHSGVYRKRDSIFDRSSIYAYWENNSG